MISEQKLLELVVGLNAECDRPGKNPNKLSGPYDNYVIVLDKHGNFVDSLTALVDGVAIFRDTARIWGLTIRPAAVHGKPMRYGNPVDVVGAALARKHGPSAFFLDQGEVRRLRNR